jgi:hypothetical protein
MPANCMKRLRDDTCTHKRAGAAAQDEAVLFTHPALADRTKTSWDGFLLHKKQGAVFSGLSFRHNET